MTSNSWIKCACLFCLVCFACSESVAFTVFARVNDQTRDFDGTTFHLVGFKHDTETLTDMATASDTRAHVTMINGQQVQFVSRDVDEVDQLDGTPDPTGAYLLWLALPSQGAVELLVGSATLGIVQSDSEIRLKLLDEGAIPVIMNVDDIPTVIVTTFEELDAALDNLFPVP